MGWRSLATKKNEIAVCICHQKLFTVELQMKVETMIYTWHKRPRCNGEPLIVNKIMDYAVYFVLLVNHIKICKSMTQSSHDVLYFIYISKRKYHIFVAEIAVCSLDSCILVAILFPLLSCKSNPSWRCTLYSYFWRFDVIFFRKRRYFFAYLKSISDLLNVFWAMDQDWWGWGWETPQSVPSIRGLD